MNADADFVELQTKRVQGLLSIDDELGLYPGAQRERLEAICARLVAWAGGAWPLSLEDECLLQVAQGAALNAAGDAAPTPDPQAIEALDASFVASGLPPISPAAKDAAKALSFVEAVDAKLLALTDDERAMVRRLRAADRLCLDDAYALLALVYKCVARIGGYGGAPQ